MTQKNRNGYANYSGYTPKNPNVNNISGGAGVLRVPGQVRDVGRYRDRLREKDREYPNRRRKIITGRDLTTPLSRKKIIEKARNQRAKAAAAVNIEVKTVTAERKKFPVNVLFAFIVVSLFIFGLICSQIVLNEQNSKINTWNDKIYTEDKKEKNLKNALESKNDYNFIINYAVSELDMVKEDSNSIQKTYISGRSSDRAEVVENKESAVINLPNIMSAIFQK